MKPVSDLEYNLRHLITFGKLIGLYPSIRIMKLVPLLLVMVTIVDWVGFILAPTPTSYRSAAEIFGKVGSPQFYSVGTFCYLYIQHFHGRLVKVYEKWKEIPSLVPDTGLTTFVNWVSGAILTSAILENISFHFKLFPVFERPIQNMTSFEVYYQRSHGFWYDLVPFTPYQATILLITNKLALYAWNFADILTIVSCRALRFRFESFHKNIESLGPILAVKRQADLMDLLRLLEQYLSPLVFVCFYLDFYATCMQLYMWITPSNHLHVLHTIYLLWAFFHLIIRIFILVYNAAKLHEASVKFHTFVKVLTTQSTTDNSKKQILRIECCTRRRVAISGLGCFFITKRFMLTFIYMAFSFEIFLLQSDSIKCTK